MSISVFANLSSRSERSLLDAVNHNVVIDGITYTKKHGVIFHMLKTSTGATFNIDVQSGDSDQIVISEGVGYQRFFVGTEVLYNLRPSVRKVMLETLRLLPGALEVNADLELADLNGLPSLADIVEASVWSQDQDRYKSAFSAAFRHNYSHDDEPDDTKLVIE